MSASRNVLTPEALAMMDVIARTGSFAAAARELGKVPSALTYNVRQLEDALDVLLFDRRSRQAKLTAAGEELLNEGRRLLEQMDAVANRVLLPRYFQYSLASGEHLRKVNQQGRANVYVVAVSGEERKVGELESQVKKRYSIASALLDASFVLPTVLALFLGWPRARDDR